MLGSQEIAWFNGVERAAFSAPWNIEESSLLYFLRGNMFGGAYRLAASRQYLTTTEEYAALANSKPTVCQLPSFRILHSPKEGQSREN